MGLSPLKELDLSVLDGPASGTISSRFLHSPCDPLALIAHPTRFFGLRCKCGDAGALTRPVMSQNLVDALNLSGLPGDRVSILPSLLAKGVSKGVCGNWGSIFWLHLSYLVHC